MSSSPLARCKAWRAAVSRRLAGESMVSLPSQQGVEYKTAAHVGVGSAQVAQDVRASVARFLDLRLRLIQDRLSELIRRQNRARRRSHICSMRARTWADGQDSEN